MRTQDQGRNSRKLSWTWIFSKEETNPFPSFVNKDTVEVPPCSLASPQEREEWMEREGSREAPAPWLCSGLSPNWAQGWARSPDWPSKWLQRLPVRFPLPCIFPQSCPHTPSGQKRCPAHRVPPAPRTEPGPQRVRSEIFVDCKE